MRINKVLDINKNNLDELEDLPLRDLLITAYNRHFYELPDFLTSLEYNSTGLLIVNPTYKLMFSVLCCAIDDYFEMVFRYQSKEDLASAKDFSKLFDWFFNQTKIDWIGNFPFICQQLRLNKQTILHFLINCTKNILSMLRKEYELR